MELILGTLACLLGFTFIICNKLYDTKNCPFDEGFRPQKALLLPRIQHGCFHFEHSLQDKNRSYVFLPY